MFVFEPVSKRQIARRNSASTASSEIVLSIAAVMVTQARRKWWHIQWYADTDTPEERKLIRKLDLLIVPYAVLSYWVK